MNIVILWGGKAIKAHNGVLGYTLPGFFWNLGALRSHLVPSGCPQGHLWTCLIRYYFWSFILIYGDRDGNLSMLKGRLQVLKQVPCDPPRKFFIIGVPRLHLSIIFFLSSSFQGGAQMFQGGANAPPPPKKNPDCGSLGVVLQTEGFCGTRLALKTPHACLKLCSYQMCGTYL